LLLVSSAGQVFAQQVLVPHLDGNKYGMADITGKVIVPAIYDDLEPDAPGYFEFVAGDTKGILHNGKEVLKAGEQDRLYVIENRFIVSQRDDCASIFTLTGSKILDDCFTKLDVADTLGTSARDKKFARYLVMVARGADRKNSILVYDTDKQEIVKTLLSDCARITSYKTHKGKELVTVIKASKDNARTDERFTVSVTAAGVARLTAFEKDSTETLEDEAEEYGDISIYPEDVNDAGNIQIKYRTEGNRLFELKTVKGNTTEREVRLPFKVQTFNLQFFSYETYAESGKIEFKNVAFITNAEGKKGFYLADSIMAKPAYDEIRLLKLRDGFKYRLNLLVRTNDKAGKAVFGITNAEGIFIVPAIYERIDLGLKSRKGQYIDEVQNHIWTVVRNNKEGLVTSENKILLEPRYDKIYFQQDQTPFGNGDFAIIERDGKYGVFGYQNNIVTIIEPAFTSKIYAYIVNYSGRKGFTIVVLKDEVTDKYVYARADGYLFSAKQ